MQVLIYDLRSSDPIRIKDHMWVYFLLLDLGLNHHILIKIIWSSCRYDSPILDIKWHSTLNSEKPKMITTDKHVVRIWDPDTVRYLSIASVFTVNLRQPFWATCIGLGVNSHFTSSISLSTLHHLKDFNSEGTIYINFL